MTFSERLRELRKSNNLTQKQAAVNFGLSTLGYQRYEYGEREPSISVATKIADFYNISVDYLLCRTNNPEINH